MTGVVLWTILIVITLAAVIGFIMFALWAFVQIIDLIDDARDALSAFSEPPQPAPKKDAPTYFWLDRQLQYHTETRTQDQDEQPTREPSHTADAT